MKGKETKQQKKKRESVRGTQIQVESVVVRTVFCPLTYLVKTEEKINRKPSFFLLLLHFTCSFFLLLSFLFRSSLFYSLFISFVCFLFLSFSCGRWKRVCSFFLSSIPFCVASVCLFSFPLFSSLFFSHTLQENEIGPRHDKKKIKGPREKIKMKGSLFLLISSPIECLFSPPISFFFAFFFLFFLFFEFSSIFHNTTGNRTCWKRLFFLIGFLMFFFSLCFSSFLFDFLLFSLIFVLPSDLLQFSLIFFFSLWFLDFSLIFFSSLISSFLFDFTFWKFWCPFGTSII